MDMAPDITRLIGNTPLISLKGPSAETGCTILGKAEFLNPGGSVKDRAAVGIIEDAEGQGLLKPGGIIVEGTAGNTGRGDPAGHGGPLLPAPATARGPRGRAECLAQTGFRCM